MFALIRTSTVLTFLIRSGVKDLATNIEVATDPDHKFDLALSLDDPSLDTALEIVCVVPENEADQVEGLG